MKKDSARVSRVAAARAVPADAAGPSLAAASTATSTPTLDALGNLHFFIDDNWEALRAECRSEAERDRMRDLQGWARDAYLQALADGLEANAGQVAELEANLTDVTAQIDGRLVVLEDISKAFAVLTKAVMFAAKVAGVVTAL